MLKGAANALGSSEECLLFRHKQTATFIHGKQKSGYRNTKTTTNRNISIRAFIFSFSARNPDKYFASICAQRHFINCCLRVFLGFNGHDD